MKERSFFAQYLVTPLIFAVVIFIYFISTKGYSTAVLVEALLTSALFALFYILFGKLFRRLRGKSRKEANDEDHQS